MLQEGVAQCRGNLHQVLQHSQQPVHRLRLLLHALVEALQRRQQGGDAVSPDQRRAQRRPTGQRLVALLHRVRVRELTQHLHRLRRDVRVVVRQQRQQRRHSAQPHQLWVQLRRSSQSAQALHLFVQVNLAVQELLGHVRKLGSAGAVSDGIHAGFTTRSAHLDARRQVFLQPALQCHHGAAHCAHVQLLQRL